MVLKTLAVIGFLLSIYAYYVEYKAKKNSNYHAICDISENVSCTKAFTSEFSHKAGLSNSIYGMLFYIVIFLLAFYNQINIIFYLAVISFLGSLYLAYVLYFKLKNFCLVCNLIYAVNILLLIFAYLRWSI